MLLLKLRERVLMENEIRRNISKILVNKLKIGRGGYSGEVLIYGIFNSVFELMEMLKMEGVINESKYGYNN